MDANLLSITTIPIDIEINIINGSFSPPDGEKPQMEITQSDGVFTIDAQPSRINIDTYAARSSMGYGEYNYSDLANVQANKGIRLAYQGTAKIVNDGNQLARGAKASDIATQNNRAGYSIQTVMDFLPKEGADITFDQGKLNINYEAKELGINWKNLQAAKLQFNPGSIEFTVNERPRVEIEYMGGPIYVPASSNPDYHPPVLNAKG